MIARFYTRYVLPYPKTVLALVVLSMVFFGYEALRLEVDASAETLVLEDDQDLRIAREINKRYRQPDFLFVTFTPKDGELLSNQSLEALKGLKADLVALKGVESVVSLLDVPLMESPPKPLKELLKDVPTLESKGIDKTLAKKEFLNSPIYRDLLVSQDFKTMALQVNLPENKTWQGFLDRRYELREKEKAGTLSAEETVELAEIGAKFKKFRDKERVTQHENIVAVRGVLAQHGGEGELFLGGVSMIADDMVTFIKNDIQVFGLGVLLFLVVTLFIIFRQLRWVLLPVLTCGFSVLATSGLLGLFGWEVTVISSNFISIQIIITMALTIHLTVRYRELAELNPEASQKELLSQTVLSMAKPCIFMVLTTIAGFASLLLSGMLPVINFGWMMSAGILVSLFLTFLLFPSVLAGMKPIQPNKAFESFFGVTKVLARYTEKKGGQILVLSGVLFVACIWGASQLRVENSFIDYFRESTEIYQGMKVIDQQLGGTTPLDVVLRFPKSEDTPTANNSANPEEEEDEEGDEFEAEFEAEKNQAKYWFTSQKMIEVEKLHDYLEAMPETGKVLSLGTMLKVGKTLNDGDPLDNFKLALVYNELPERFRKIILNPYVSVEDDQVRFSVRIIDSDPTLRRDAMLKKMNRQIRDDLNIPADRFQVAGIMVLYNNMLQSLFNSQILTLGAVVGALMVMFLILFRSLKISFIAIFPNILSVGTVLGFMGWMNIPLDMMTITIAAISVGIAVDDTIHYIHRFKEEFKTDGDYIAAMHRCHNSIGYAMYYTSVTIVIGFSILVLSNFIPSIYFGLLTGMAMVIALLASLTLLPQLILALKPFGPGKAKV